MKEIGICPGVPLKAGSLSVLALVLLLARAACGETPSTNAIPFIGTGEVFNVTFSKPGRYKIVARSSSGEQKTLYVTAGNQDTDGDGLADWWEMKYFGSPTAADPSQDSDNDTLTNLQEYQYGTDPLDSNSFPANISGTITYTGSQTGLIWVVAVTSSNSWSTNHSVTLSSPGAYAVTDLANLTNYWLKAYRDSNGNESNDYWEAQGTASGSPYNLTTNMDGVAVALADPDTDADSLPDWWEVKWWGDAANGVASGDDDQDGLTNLQEYQQGACPTNSDTDQDGLADFGEYIEGTDPSKADSDTNGITDLAQVTAGYGLVAPVGSAGPSSLASPSPSTETPVKYRITGTVPFPSVGTWFVKMPWNSRHRVDLMGRPIAEQDPASLVESDTPPDKTHVDMFSLQPSYTMTDVYVPSDCESSLIGFRRTIAAMETEFPPEGMLNEPNNLLGPGWGSSLGMYAVIRGVHDTKDMEATVTDEVGDSCMYKWMGGATKWQPATTFAFDNKAQRATMTGNPSVSGITNHPPLSFVITRRGQTKLTFTRVYYYTSSRTGYYRIANIVDRNTNTITYAYDQNLHKLSPVQIADSNHPSLKMDISYRALTNSLGVLCTRINWVKDAFGNQTTYEYFTTDNPANGRYWGWLSRVVQPGNRSVSYTYEKRDITPTWQTSRLYAVAPKTVTDARGAVTTFFYNSTPTPGRLYTDSFGAKHVDNRNTLALQSVSVGGMTTTFSSQQRSLDTSANLSFASSVSCGSFQSSFLFEGRIVGNALSLYDNSYLNVISSVQRTDAMGQKSTFNYLPGNLAATETNQFRGNLCSVYDVNGHLTTFEYGTPGGDNSVYGLPSRCIKQFSGGNLTNSYVYEATFKKLQQFTDPMGGITESQFDLRGNRTTEKRAVGTAAEALTQISYDNSGFVTKIIDPENQTSTFSRSFGADTTLFVTIQATDPLGHTSTTIRDVMGNLRRSTDANNNLRTFDYDSLYRLTAEHLPAVASGASAILHTYDANGNETVTTTENGANPLVINRQYDALNRLTEQHNNGISQRWYYNASGFLSSQSDALGHVTSYTYDNAGRLTMKQRTVAGRVERTSYAYTRNAASGAFGDMNWRASRITNPRGFDTVNVYDDVYRLTSSSQSGGRSVSYTYDKNGRKKSETVVNDTDNQTTLWAPNPLGWVTNVIVDAGGLSLNTKKEYDKTGNLRFVTDPEGRRTENVYDGVSRLVQVNYPAVSIFNPVTGATSQVAPNIRYGYDSVGNKIWQDDPNGNRNSWTYDARNRRITAVVARNGEGSVPPATSTTGYDLAGNVTQRTDPNGNRTDYAYDYAFRLTTVTAPAMDVYDSTGVFLATVRPVTGYTYDLNGNVLTVTDPKGYVAQNTYDEANRLLVIVLNVTGPVESRRETRREYDLNGNLSAIALVNRVGGVEHLQRTAYSYDALDQKICEVLPQPVSYMTNSASLVQYYMNGMVKATTDAKGQVCEFDYDKANRKTATRFKRTDGTIAETRAFVYDKVGNLLGVTDAQGQSAYVYDTLNRVVSETRSGAGTIYTVRNRYDAVGNRTKVEYPDAAGTGVGRSLVSRYSSRQLVTVVTDSSDNGQSTYTYDANGNQAGSSLPNGQVTVNTFDAFNRLLTRTTAKGGVSSYALLYRYEILGNRCFTRETTPTLGVRETSHSYDPFSQLTSESWTLAPPSGPPETSSTSYAYDLAGNRLRQTVVRQGQPELTSYIYYDCNELRLMASATDTTRYNYDANGSRIGKRSGDSSTIYQYDAQNRLVAATNGAVPIFAAGYDDRTRRLTKIEGETTTLFRYDSGDSFQELEGGSLKVEYVRGSGLGGGIGSILYSDRSGANEYFTYNAVGHTVSLTDGSGVAVESDFYGAFGNITSSSGLSLNNRLANTKERDSSIGLDNHGMRYYDPEIGRYISSDPAGYADGLNVYLYVHNNPINHIDPFGLAPGDWWDVRTYFNETLLPALGENSKAVGMAASEGAQGMVEAPVNLVVGGYNLVSGIGTYSGNLYVDPSGTWNQTVSIVQALPDAIPGMLEQVASDPKTIGGLAGDVMLGAGIAKIAQAGKLAQLSKLDAAIPEETLAAKSVPEGSFFIIDWKGCSANLPKPAGPFQIIEGQKYTAACNAANQANRAMYQADAETNIRTPNR